MPENGERRNLNHPDRVVLLNRGDRVPGPRALRLRRRVQAGSRSGYASTTVKTTAGLPTLLGKHVNYRGKPT